MILLIEDRPSDREVLKNSLEWKGYEVITATNTKDAIKAVDWYKNKLKLVIMDIILPFDSKPDADTNREESFKIGNHLKKLRGNNNFKKIPILLITAYPMGNAHYLRQELDHPFPFLMKPLAIPEFLNKVQQMLKL